MFKIKSDIKSNDDFVAVLEEFQGLIKEQVDVVANQVVEMIKSKGVKVEMTEVESQKDGDGFRIMIDPGDIEKANRMGLQKKITKSVLIMVKQRIISEFR